MFEFEVKNIWSQTIYYESIGGNWFTFKYDKNGKKIHYRDSFDNRKVITNNNQPQDM